MLPSWPQQPSKIDIAIVVAAAATGAIIGDGIRYMVGRRFGTPFLRKYGRYVSLDENRLLIGRYLFFRYGNAEVKERSQAELEQLTSAIREMASRVSAQFVIDDQKAQNFIIAAEQREKIKRSA